MSEIKFRAWDNEQKKMFYSKTEQFDDSLNFRFGHFDTEEPVYMQFTGLHDKNGREIYEGDIIEYLHEGNGFVTKGHGAYGIETRFGFYPFIEIYGEAEVIGNIYENPELLEGEE